MKFRVMTSPILIRSQAYGANPVQHLPWGEVYGGLRR